MTASKLHKPESRTVQKTLRVPRYLLSALEEETVKIEGLTVPKAMVQILEAWYADSGRAPLVPGRV